MNPERKLSGKLCAALVAITATCFAGFAGTIDTFDDKRPPGTGNPAPQFMSVVVAPEVEVTTPPTLEFEVPQGLNDIASQIPAEDFDVLVENFSDVHDRLTVRTDDDAEIDEIGLAYTVLKLRCVRLNLKRLGSVITIDRVAETEDSTGSPAESFISVMVNNELARKAIVMTSGKDPNTVSNELIARLAQKGFDVIETHPIVIYKDSWTMKPLRDVEFCSEDPIIVSGNVHIGPL